MPLTINLVYFSFTWQRLSLRLTKVRSLAEGHSSVKTNSPPWPTLHGVQGSTSWDCRASGKVTHCSGRFSSWAVYSPTKNTSFLTTSISTISTYTKQVSWLGWTWDCVATGWSHVPWDGTCFSTNLKRRFGYSSQSQLLRDTYSDD